MIDRGAEKASTRRSAGIAYWALAIALMAFGFLAIFSIGFPFFVIGFELALLAPVRRRPTIFWPTLAGTIAFVAAYALVAPLNCTRWSGFWDGPSAGVHREGVRCGNVLGIDYSGGATYQAPLVPALLAAFVVAIVMAWFVRRAVRRRSAALTESD